MSVHQAPEVAGDLCELPEIREWVLEYKGEPDKTRERIAIRTRWHVAGHPLSLDEFAVEEKNPMFCLLCHHHHDNQYGDACLDCCDECMKVQQKIAEASGHWEGCRYTLKATGEEIDRHLKGLLDADTAEAEAQKCGIGYWMWATRYAYDRGKEDASKEINAVKPPLTEATVQLYSVLERQAIEAESKAIDADAPMIGEPIVIDEYRDPEPHTLAESLEQGRREKAGHITLVGKVIPNHDFEEQDPTVKLTVLLPGDPCRSCKWPRAAAIHVYRKHFFVEGECCIYPENDGGMHYR